MTGPIKKYGGITPSAREPGKPKPPTQGPVSSAHHPGTHTGSDGCPICLKSRLDAAVREANRLRADARSARGDAAAMRRRAEKAEDSNRVLRRVRDELQGQVKQLEARA